MARKRKKTGKELVSKKTEMAKIFESRSSRHVRQKCSRQNPCHPARFDLYAQDDVFANAPSLRVADILNFRMRALFKRPRRSSKNQTRSRPQSGCRRRSMHTNWQKRSRKINLKFLAGGFPPLMVEKRFQALPETSNRRFSLAEISGTGLICDRQNF